MEMGVVGEMLFLGVLVECVVADFGNALLGM